MKKVSLLLLLCTPACFAADDKELAELTDRMAALQQVQDLTNAMYSTVTIENNEMKYWFNDEQSDQAKAQQIEANKAAFALAPKLLASATADEKEAAQPSKPTVEEMEEIKLTQSKKTLLLNIQLLQAAKCNAKENKEGFSITDPKVMQADIDYKKASELLALQRAKILELFEEELKTEQ